MVIPAGTARPSTGKILFVSHAYADMEHALLLKKAVEGSFANVLVFDASDSGTLKPGEDWVHEVLDNLRDSVLILVIASERSMKRVWVWFEAGACWQRTSRLLTCTVGKLSKGSLPLPYGIYMALSLSIPDDLQTLFEILAERLGPTTRLPDFDHLANRFREIETTILGDQQALEDPLIEERWKLTRKALDELDEPQRRAMQLLLLYGGVTDAAMLNRLHQLQVGQNWASVLPGLQYQTNLVQKVPGQPAVHPNLAPNSIEWEIKPDFRPLVRRYFEEKGTAG
jgi:hypothetical protein